MKNATLLTLFLSILLFSSAISTASATIVKEYEHDTYVDGIREFAFKVKIVIETELNDQWFVGSKYLVHFIATPTYVNPNIFEPVNFTILFHSPEMYLAPDGSENILTNKTANQRLYWTGMLVLECSPNIEKRQRLWPAMYYAVYYKNELILNNPWDSWEPVYIDVSSPSLLSIQLVFVIVGIFLGVTITSAFFIYKIRKR